MALTKDILDDFFNHSKSQKTLIKIHNSSEFINTNSALPKKQYKNYRVFDDPLESGQTQDKPKTNTGQSWDKEKTKPTTNLSLESEIQNKVGTELKTENRTNLRQSWDETSIKINFSSLVGLQRKIVLFLYEICKASRNKTTNSLSIEHIALSCKTTKSSAQKTIQRLEKKLILKRVEFKNGRSGWTRYELIEHIYQEILYDETQDKFKTNIGQSWDKVESEIRTEPKTSISSSSGIDYINTTTTSDTKNSSLSTEWENLDIEPLATIGFTKIHLTQIASQNKLQVLSVQNSIYAFAFDLQKNDKAKSIKGDPINFFMGILRNGKPYAPPSNYESPQDEAMRIYLEKMREVEQKRVDAEKEAINLAFNDWFSKLTDEQKIGFLPEMLRRTAIQRNKNGEKLDKSKILESSARKHFEVEIWPKKKAEIIQQTVKEDETSS